MEYKGINQAVPMTRRYPPLKDKVAKRDSKISSQLIKAWDIEKDADKVLLIYLQNVDKLSSYRYWELMRTVWVICGSVERADLFRELMRSTKKNQHYFSTPEEHKKLRELPYTFVVYRATNNENDEGLSWTLSEKYAKWYKAAYDKEKVISKTIDRTDVFAYIERNNEDEIIIL